MTSSQYLTLWTSLPSYDHEQLHTHARYFSFVLGKTSKWKKIKRTQHLWHFNRWWYVWENEFETIASCCGFFLKVSHTHPQNPMCFIFTSKSVTFWTLRLFVLQRDKRLTTGLLSDFDFFYFIYEHTHTHAHSSKTLQTNAEITCQMDVSHCLNW